MRPQALALSPDAARLVVGVGAPPRLLLFDARERRALRDLGPLRSLLREVTFSRDGQRLLAACGDKNELNLPSECALSVYETGTWSLQVEHPFHSVVRALVTAPDQARVLVGTIAGEVLELDSASGEILSRYVSPGDEDLLQAQTAHRGSLRGLVFSPDGRLLYSICQGGVANKNELRVWDPVTRAEVRPHIKRVQQPESLTLSADGRWLALGTQSGEVEVWATEPLAPGAPTGR